MNRILCRVIADYKYGIRLATSVDDKILITLNARSENDRTKFVEDLKEAILEVCQLMANIIYAYMDITSLVCRLCEFLAHIVGSNARCVLLQWMILASVSW